SLSSPTRHPSRGVCPFSENRTSFIRVLLCRSGGYPSGTSGWPFDRDDSTGARPSHPRGWLHPVWYPRHASICSVRCPSARLSCRSSIRFATIVPGGQIHDDLPPLAVCDGSLHLGPGRAVRDLDGHCPESHAAAKLDPQRAAVRLRRAHRG